MPSTPTDPPRKSAVAAVPAGGHSYPLVRLRRALLRPWLLLLIDTHSGYGYDMRRALRERGFDAEPSSIYRNLREMEKQELVASEWATSTDGPERRVYNLTAKGRQELEAAAATFAQVRNPQSEFLQAYLIANSVAEAA